MPKPNDAMQQILDAHAAMGPLPIELMTVENARQMPLLDRAALAVYGQHFTKRALAPMPLPVGKVEHRMIPQENHEQLLRIYTPKGNAPKGGWPVIVYYHGGGWVLATLDTYDASARALCEGAQAIVISADYRQAPEHIWPAAHEDALNAYQWACENARQLNGTPKKIAVAGESAGGNMAAVVCLMARDKGLPMPIHQLLVYPVTDLAEGPDSASARTNRNAKPLNTDMLRWFYDKYVPLASDRTDPYVSPFYGELAGLPSATVILAEIDPLRTEGQRYAEKLKLANVPVELQQYDGVTHEFFGLAGLLSEATDAMKLACEQLQQAFAEERARNAA